MADEPESTITEHTRVNVGLILALAMAAFGSVGGITAWVWWASGVSTRLSSIESYMSAQAVKTAAIDLIASRVTMIETYGSKPSQDALNKLSADLIETRRILDLHIARTVKDP